MNWQRILIAMVAVLSVTSIWAGEEEVLTSRVSLAAQTMYVYVGDILIYEWSVSTARPGYKTPPGDYTPYLLSKNHRSKIYENAPMPYAIFFLRGYAVHGTTARKALGRPASHGCVRLLTENAQTLFMLVKIYGKQRTRIVIES